MSDELESLVQQMYREGTLYHEAVSEFQKAFVAAVLRECRGNLSKAAPRLGLHRNTLSRTMAQLGLDVAGFRPSARRPPGSVIAAARKTISRP